MGSQQFSLEVSEPQKSTEASSPSFPIACWSSLSRVSRSPCIQPSNLLLKPCWLCLLKQAPGSVSITLNFCFHTPSTALFPDLLAVSRDHGTCPHHPLLPDALQMQSAPSNRPQHCRRRGHDSLVSPISAQPKQETCLISASVSSCKGLFCSFRTTRRILYRPGLHTISNTMSPCGRGRHFLSLAAGWAVSTVVEMPITPWPAASLRPSWDSVVCSARPPLHSQGLPLPQLQPFYLWLVSH